MRTKIEDGGPAFPLEQPHPDGGTFSSKGMSLRDYFAAQVMVGIVNALAQGIRPHDVPKAAQDAYFIADAMLKARK